MRYVVWILRLLVFVLVLLFALKNTGPVDVNFFADLVVHDVPLIVVMLVMLVLGGALGVLAIVPAVMRKRREIKRLRRRVAELEDQARSVSDEPEVAPEVIAPLAPL